MATRRRSFPLTDPEGHHLGSGGGGVSHRPPQTSRASLGDEGAECPLYHPREGDKRGLELPRAEITSLALLGAIKVWREQCGIPTGIFPRLPLISSFPETNCWLGAVSVPRRGFGAGGGNSL